MRKHNMDGVQYGENGVQLGELYMYLYSFTSVEKEFQCLFYSFVILSSFIVPFDYTLEGTLSHFIIWFLFCSYSAVFWICLIV